MEIDFFNSQCQSVSNKKRFGLCDEQDDKEPAYLDERNGAKWIAVVENDELKEVHFIAIDYCIEIWRDDDPTKMEKRVYIANKAHPTFKESQLQRMKNFKQETGYTLRIENRIKIPSY